ncbi:MAG: 50S ribosomal protein L17 [Lentisphaeria bacterium]|nr:50S ribosomal protein L17 [Lentisphaeria bacterium]
MRHRVDTFKIGRSGSHRRAMLANMATSLFEHGKIETTLVKAKELRRFAEKLITIAKKNDLHRRRIAVSRLRDKFITKKLFDEIAPGYAERVGGYTRILKLAQRRGDAAEMCIIMLVEAGAPEKKAAEKKAPAKKAAKAPKAEETKDEEKPAEEQK